MKNSRASLRGLLALVVVTILVGHRPSPRAALLRQRALSGRQSRFLRRIDGVFPRALA
jgi:hypothetical protein